MPELAQVETPKNAGFVQRGSNYARKQKRMEEEEAEIARLEAEARGETVEEKSDGEGSETAKVSDESNTEQEETQAQSEASEDDSNLSREEKSFKKRYGDLRRHMNEKENEWKEKFSALEKRMAGENIVPPKSNEDIEEWAKKYPDVAGIVEAIAEKKANERATELDGRLKEIEEMRSTAKRERAEAELAKLHPDFADIRADDAFHEWASSQPKVVQDALYENSEDAKSVARVIDLYKSDKGITAKKTSSSDKDAASSVKNKRNAAVDPNDSSSYLTESQVAKMSIKEYEKRAEEIMEAQRSGKFIYDMSKR